MMRRGDLWRALADPTRRAILDALRAGPRTTGQLCAPFSVTRYAIMKHLRILTEAKLVLIRRRGRERWNYLNAVPLRLMYERWVSRFEGQLAGSLSRLKNYSELPQGVTDMGSQMMPVQVSALTVEQEIKIDAPREKVFAAITTDIEKWWAYRGSARMHLEAWPGGRFYEGEENGDGFLWGTVLEVRSPSVLRVSELLGSLPTVRAGAHKYELEDDGGSTILKFSCQLLGEIDDDARGCLESGWGTLLSTHLRNWTEKGIACEVSA